MTVFDDAWLDDRASLAGADEVLRRLASAGARLRREFAESVQPTSQLHEMPRPRAVVAAGAEARFIRAIVEPVCPVPFVAWAAHGLPGWVGALDLVVVLASDAADAGLISTVHEAVRRGAQLIIACPEGSPISEHASGTSTTLLPTSTGDTMAAAIVAITGMHVMQLAPEVEPNRVAEAMDRVAEDCSPFLDATENPAKEIALGLAEAQPLIWGGSVLAARASRRVAEAVRAASGRAALAADVDALLPVLDAAAPRDPFADPFEDVGSSDRRPSLIVLDDGNGDDWVSAGRVRLTAAADRNDVRVNVIAHQQGSAVERYAALLQTGMYASVYLAVGLGRYLEL